MIRRASGPLVAGLQLVLKWFVAYQVIHSSR